MSDPNYTRVIPRDLFNEANLLKCLGALWIKTEGLDSVEIEHDGEPFSIGQASGSGELSVLNISIAIRGKKYRHLRPMNSREPWPLYLVDDDDNETEVFTDAGDLSPEMLSLIEGRPQE